MRSVQIFLFGYSFNPSIYVCFFFNDTATTEIYTLSLHDALPILNDKEDKGDWNKDWDAVKTD